MAYPTTVFLQVLLLTVLNVGQHNCVTRTTLETAARDRNTSGFIGDNLTWTYYRNGTQKYMYLSSAHETSNSIYNFIQEPNGTNHVSISFMNPQKNYLYIGADSRLIYTVSWSQRTIFQVVPVPGSQTKFHLHFNSIDPLVTRSGGEPFVFYPKSRYPNELSAEFYLLPPSAREYYGGKLENVLPTLKRIRNGDHGDKDAAYWSLLAEMKKYNHHLEHELFTVGTYIKEDLGVTSDAFLQLPYQAQLIISGEHLTLYYNCDLPTHCTMKYDTAADQTIVFPYTFTYHSNATSDTWAITNVGEVAEHQLFVEQKGSFYLMERVSEYKEFVFKFKLVDGEHAFNIFNFRKKPFVTRESNKPFYFYEGKYQETKSAGFYVQKYSREINEES